MASAGAVFKSVSQQFAEMDEMDLPDKEWNINDEVELSTQEVIDVLWNSGIPSMVEFGDKLSDILDRELGLE